MSIMVNDFKFVMLINSNKDTLCKEWAFLHETVNEDHNRREVDWTVLSIFGARHS